MKEDIEFKKTEKSTIDRLEELKEEEIQRAKEENDSTPWNVIIPEHLRSDVKDIFELFEKDEIDDVFIEKFDNTLIGVEKEKNEEVKSSNKNFMSWIRSKTDAKYAGKKIQEQREKDNI